MLFSVRDAKDTELRHFIVSCFVMSISGRWFLVTAGHCINHIERLKKLGGEIVECDLIDSLGSATKHPEPVNIPYNELGVMSFLDSPDDGSEPSDLSLDYGLIPLSPMYVDLLRKNNIRPLDERIWKDLPDHFEHYFVVGYPASLQEISVDRRVIKACSFPIERLDERPSVFPESKFPRLYGRIQADIESIEGLSGAPIFGVCTDDKGVSRYYLVALQSSWNPEGRLIAGNPISNFDSVLKDAVARLKERLDIAA